MRSPISLPFANWRSVAASRRRDRSRTAPSMCCEWRSASFSCGRSWKVVRSGRFMVDERIRTLPIVDGLQVVGVITRRDLLRCSLTHDDAPLLEGVTLQVLHRSTET